MAPRLSRWIALTVTAAAVVATMLLTTGGTPLLFLWWGRVHQEEGEKSRISRQMEGVQTALQRVKIAREMLDRRAQIVTAIAGEPADPVVLRWEGERLAVDRAATVGLDLFWRTLPDRRPEIRTVVLQGRRPGGSVNLAGDLDAGGLCLVTLGALRSPVEMIRDIRSGGGECLFAERFGAPGTGVRRWLDGVPSGLSWDRVRRWQWYARESEWETGTPPAWFEKSVGGPYLLSGNWVWRPVNRLEMACLVGRSEECGPAAGVTEAGWPERGQEYGYASHQFPDPRLPRDLLQAVGPEKFAEIWTADAPIAASYARVTGVPIEGWLGSWARRFTGSIRRDNGLSLGGWLGAVVWISLLGALTALRFKDRAAA